MTNRRWQRRFFTLAELSVAMIVLMLIMYALFRTIAGAQAAWNGSRAMSEIHQNASLALDVITRDLRAMKVSDVEGAKINFSYNGSGTPTSFAFVTTSGLGVDPSSDKTQLAEVGYSLSSTDSTLYRWRTTQSATAAWNFYEQPPSSWAAGASWEDSVALATSVESVSFEAYTDSVTKMTASSDTYSLPSFVKVSLTLVDERVDAQAQKKKSRLSFSKTIHLNRSE